MLELTQISLRIGVSVSLGFHCFGKNLRLLLCNMCFEYVAELFHFAKFFYKISQNEDIKYI